MEPLRVLQCSPPLTREPLDAEQASGLARVFKALGDLVRLRILSIVGSYEGGEVYLCDISGSLVLFQPIISDGLKVLGVVGLLACVRRASWAYSRLAPDRLGELSAPLDTPAAD